MDKWFKRRRDKRQRAKNRPTEDFQDLLYDMTYNPKDSTNNDPDDDE